MTNSVGTLTGTAEVASYEADGLNSLSGAHAGQYELSFTTAPPIDFSVSMIFVTLDHVALGKYFLEGSHQRLAYFRGDGGGSYEGTPFVLANLPETDPSYDPTTRITCYMPPGWTLV